MGEMQRRVAAIIDNYEAVHPTMTTADYKAVSVEVLESMQIPSNRAVAHAADKLQMDPTKVAAVWMCIIEGELKDG